MTIRTFPIYVNFGGLKDLLGFRINSALLLNERKLRLRSPDLVTPELRPACFILFYLNAIQCNTIQVLSFYLKLKDSDPGLQHPKQVLRFDLKLKDLDAQLRFDVR